MVAGFLGAAASAMAGGEDERELVDRKLFQEIVLSGRTTLDGDPTGDVALDIAGFELLGVRGPAGASGVQIGDGVLDLALRAKLRGADGMRLDIKPTFDNLSMSEPRTVRSPPSSSCLAPLDSVIFLLKDAGGEIKTPVKFGLTDKGISVAEVSAQASLALGRVIASAAAGSALRVGGAVTGLFGSAEMKNPRKSSPRSSRFGSRTALLARVRKAGRCWPSWRDAWPTRASSAHRWST